MSTWHLFTTLCSLRPTHMLLNVAGRKWLTALTIIPSWALGATWQSDYNARSYSPKQQFHTFSFFLKLPTCPLPPLPSAETMLPRTHKESFTPHLITYHSALPPTSEEDEPALLRSKTNPFTHSSDPIPLSHSRRFCSFLSGITLFYSLSPRPFPSV